MSRNVQAARQGSHGCGTREPLVECRPNVGRKAEPNEHVVGIALALEDKDDLLEIAGDEGLLPNPQSCGVSDPYRSPDNQFKHGLAGKPPDSDPVRRGLPGPASRAQLATVSINQCGDSRNGPTVDSESIATHEKRYRALWIAPSVRTPPTLD